MISIAPATGPDNSVELQTLVTSMSSVALKAGSIATALGNITLQIQAINLQLLKANRGAAVGVKSLTAGNNYSVNKAVLERRNTLAGAEDQFPIPPTPPGI
jgi:hypothetical protein